MANAGREQKHKIIIIIMPALARLLPLCMKNTG